MALRTNLMSDTADHSELQLWILLPFFMFGLLALLEFVIFPTIERILILLGIASQASRRGVNAKESIKIGDRIVKIPTWVLIATLFSGVLIFMNFVGTPLIDDVLRLLGKWGTNLADTLTVVDPKREFLVQILTSCTTIITAACGVAALFFTYRKDRRDAIELDLKLADLRRQLAAKEHEPLEKWKLDIKIQEFEKRLKDKESRPNSSA
jgi:hypothetical protein